MQANDSRHDVSDIRSVKVTLLTSIDDIMVVILLITVVSRSWWLLRSQGLDDNSGQIFVAGERIKSEPEWSLWRDGWRGGAWWKDWGGWLKNFKDTDHNDNDNDKDKNNDIDNANTKAKAGRIMGWCLIWWTEWYGWLKNTNIMSKKYTNTVTKTTQTQVIDWLVWLVAWLIDWFVVRDKLIMEVTPDGKTV